jgi:hypothetical protein
VPEEPPVDVDALVALVQAEMTPLPPLTVSDGSQALVALAALAKRAEAGCEFGCGPTGSEYVTPGFGLVPACPVHGWVCELLDARDARLAEVEREKERYRIEADCGLRDYDALELRYGHLREACEAISNKRPNKTFDPWAVEVAAAALRSTETGDSAALAGKQ